MIELNEKLSFFYLDKNRFKIAFGGRAGAKSHSIAICLLMLGYDSSLRILCLREFQNNLEESVYQLLCDKISEDPAFEKFYTIQRSAIYGANGTKIIFSGIRDAKNIKSFEGADIAWVEEAQVISQKSLDILIPTIRKPGSELWFSFNPEDEKDPMYQFGVINQREGMKSLHINYLDNPHCPEVMLDEARYCQEHDQEKYEHIWLGKPFRMSDTVVFKDKFIVEDFEIKTYYEIDYFNEKRCDYRYGMDFGFSIDPFATIECFAHEGILYITKEIYAYRLENDDIIPILKEKIPNALRYKIFADSQRPDTISQLTRVRNHRDGYQLEALNIEGAIKGKGSVMDGVEFLRNFKKIIIHPSCKNTIFEMNNYKYKQDEKTGEIFRDLIDRHNHIIDALRYAWNQEIQALYSSKISAGAVTAVGKLFGRK